MQGSYRDGWSFLLRRSVGCLLIMSIAACSSDSGGPDGSGGVERVTVVSNIGPIIPASGTAQLTAVGLDGSGQPVPGTSFTWTSTNGAVVSVSPAGVATGLAAGFAGVSATTATNVVGSITLQVVQVNLNTVEMLANDAFADALVDALSASGGSAVRAAWTGCVSGAASGNITAIKLCTDEVQSSALAATDPTDRALLASLVLYADEIERLIGV
jgi:hypothetical protein